MSTLLIILCLVLVRCTHCWWDQCHMVIAAIAKQRMLPTSSEKLQLILGKWEEMYPGMSNIPAAAVWADHIKCSFSSYNCEGSKRHDSIFIFNDLHYVIDTYNPQNIKLDKFLEMEPAILQSARSALPIFYESLTGRSIKKGDSITTNLHHPNSHVNETIAKEPENVKDRGTFFSWNLHLRLFIHIYGDIHQPLHTMTTYSQLFPTGDSGGDKIHVGGFPHSTGIRTLHHVWDSAGGEMTLTWPSFNDNDADVLAENLMKLYPYEMIRNKYDANRKAFDISGIVDESFEAAREYAFMEWDWSKEKPIKLPYHPSAKYMNMVREVTQERLALAGYRLANVLEDIIQHCPDALLNDMPKQATSALPPHTLPFTHMPTNQKIWALLCGISTSLSILLGWALVREKRKIRVISPLETVSLKTNNQPHEDAIGRQ